MAPRPFPCHTRLSGPPSNGSSFRANEKGVGGSVLGLLYQCSPANKGLEDPQPRAARHLPWSWLTLV